MASLKFRQSIFNNFLFVGLFYVFFNRSCAKRVSLLDTTIESALQWQTYTASPSSEDGWLEESYTKVQDGVNWRSYVVCDVRKENVNNWVRTPFILRGEARRISVEVTFTMRDCRRFPYTARTCKETFALLAYEAEIDFASADQPPWIDAGSNSYKRIDRLTAVAGRFTDKESVQTNVETRQVPLSKKGVYLAFRDEGACISLLSVKVYYEVCEERIINFARFPETTVGSNLTAIQDVRGNCVENASPPTATNSPKYFCKGDGTWDLLSGGCQCNPGYRAEGASCLPCDIGFYKDTPGISGCIVCPSRSYSKSIGSTFCECEKGSYRWPSDSKSSPCTSVPSPPRDLQLIKIDQSQAVLSWRAPDDDFGSRSSSNFWYRIDCLFCPSDTGYVPRKNRLNSTSVTLTNLESATTYSIYVYAENDFTDQLLDGKISPSHLSINITTHQTSKISEMRSLRIDQIASTELKVGWDVPDFWRSNDVMDYVPRLPRPGKPISIGDLYQQAPASQMSTMSPEQRKNSVRHYLIRLYLKDKETQKQTLVPPLVYSGGVRTPSNETATTLEPFFTFRDLMPDSEYGFQVRANTVHGWSTWSEIIWTKTNISQGSAIGDDGVSTSSFYTPGVIAGIVVGLVAFVAFLICLVIVCRNRNNNGGVEKRKAPGLGFKKDPLTIVHCHQHPQLSMGHDGTMHRRTMTPFHSMSRDPTASLFGSSSSKHYVDPLTYEDSNRRLSDFANEIDSKDILIEEAIGEGEFGTVCKGKLIAGRFGASRETVAIKTLKVGSSEKSRSDFLMEASIMCQFDHPNVIRLKGVVTRKEPAMIITEFVEHGSLDRFLQENRRQLELHHLVSMMRGIACGMAYLSDMGFVHRDLAARNILVDASLLCKIADFGLSRTLVDGSSEQIYMTKGGKIPVRWTSPEALSYRKFTSASDVWSFGVVMWEVMSFGRRPFGQWTNQEVMEAVEKGYRLEIPESCPQGLYQLMHACWEQERNRRPIFSSIFQTLDQFLQYPETLLASLSNISSPISQHSASLSSLPSSSMMRPSTSGINGHPSTGSSSGFISITAGNLNHASGPISPSSSDHVLSQIKITDFLRDLNLEQLATIFQNRNHYTVGDLTRLTIVDFSSMGIQVQDQKRIREAIDRLRRQNAPRRPYFHERPPPPPPPPLVASASLSRRLHSNNTNAKDGYFV